MTGLRLAALFGAAVLIVAAGVAGHLARQPASLSLRFTASVDGARLIFDEFRYDNPGGDGLFKVRDFQLFISNLRLTGDDGGYAEIDSVHLLRFDNADGTFTITLPDLPRQRYRAVEFVIGLDAASNSSIRAVGDLDPNGRMAWSWETGYKFVLFEGSLMRGVSQLPLVYHVGFDDSARRVGFDVDLPLHRERQAMLSFDVDARKLFHGVQLIDMAALPSVKFDRADAARIAANLEFAITATGVRDAVE
jgi:hypothetical protein